MGAWGYGPFDNDDALDFLGALKDGDETIASLIGRLTVLGYLDASAGSQVVAALALVAGSRWAGSVSLPEGLEGLDLGAVPTAELQALVDRVTGSPETSELRELLAEDPQELRAWLNEVHSLASRL
ncbi:DUF4259 domain-containing protein [Leifsonia xyli]|uniref:DUF4259 domain-containing protein n=1 Tax=Leifsonia xyli TaxID=1575 RepID=UPI000A70ACD1